MGLILNALDGFDDTNNTIRFFTGNNCDTIFNEKALINRISGKYYFDYPSREMFKNKLIKLLLISKLNDNNEISEEFLHKVSSCDFEEKVNKFIDLVSDKNLTLRPFTSYCIRYLFNDNCLDDMIENISELI